MKNPYYRTFSSFLLERFGEKVYRISLDAGFTCPNRDGTIGEDGCAYCLPEGSWKEKDNSLSLLQQLIQGKEAVKKRYNAKKFIAYFQAYTNTYGPVEKLKSVYDSVVRGDPDIVGIAVGTRPDCIDREKLDLLAEYSQMGLLVLVEYGLQSAKDETLRLIDRGHTAGDFSSALERTKKHDILVSAHVIIGLPRESRKDIINTAQFLADLPLDGVKIHNLNIVKNTKVADMYYRGELEPLELEVFAGLTVDFLEYTNPEVIVDRLVAESNPAVLIEPKWSLNKQKALAAIWKKFEKRNSYQGKLFKPRNQ